MDERLSAKQNGDRGFLSPWREYADSNRRVFLEESLNFVRTVDRLELADIRKAVQAARARQLRKGGKRGCPPGFRHSNRNAARELGVAEKQCDSAEFGMDEHAYFRDVCVACIDFPHLRPVFLKQILCFIRGANKHELAAIGESVPKRAKSPELLKKRGRPGAEDDSVAYKARKVAWHRYIDGWDWKKIAEAVEMPVTETNKQHEGNSGTVRWTLRRLEGYLAARIWEAVPQSYVVHKVGQPDELRPRALEHKPLQQILWSRAALPFRTHPQECKKIVTALWPRAQGAALEQFERRYRYFLKKKTS